MCIFKGKRDRTGHDKAGNEKPSGKVRVLESDKSFASSSAVAVAGSAEEHEAWVNRQKEKNQELQHTLELMKALYEIEKARNELNNQ